MISELKDIVVGLSAAYAAFFAYKGLNTWQSEIRGKANFETARNLMKAVYKLRDSIEVCRSPWIPASEFPEGYPPLHKDRTPEIEGAAQAHVYGNRWERVYTSLQEFDAATLEAEALWGREIAECALELRRCANSLYAAIEANIFNAYSGNRDFENREFASDVRADLSATKPEKNKLTLRIKAAIEGIENEIRPHLSRS